MALTAYTVSQWVLVLQWVRRVPVGTSWYSGYVVVQWVYCVAGCLMRGGFQADSSETPIVLFDDLGKVSVSDVFKDLLGVLENRGPAFPVKIAMGERGLHPFLRCELCQGGQMFDVLTCVCFVSPTTRRDILFWRVKAKLGPHHRCFPANPRAM